MSTAGPFDGTGTLPADPDEGPLATPEQEAAAAAALGALGPVAMPAPVWDRLERALAGEPPLATPQPAGGAPSSASPAVVVPLDQAPSRRRRPGAVLGLLAGAAAAVVALVVGVQVLRPVDGSGDAVSEGAASSAAGASAAPDAGNAPAFAAAPAMLASGTDYRDETLPDQVGGVVAVRTMLADKATRPSPSPPPSPGTLSSGMAYAARPATDGERAGTFVADPAGVDACLAALHAGTTSSSVLFVDLATYRGQPVAVMVVGVVSLNPVGRPVDVWVVGRGCGPADPQLVVRRHLLLP